MLPLAATIDYISSGGNRYPSAADWDQQSGVLAFGAGQNIALWRPQQSSYSGIYDLVPGSTDTVTAVRFAPVPKGLPSTLVSGSSDSSIRVWKGSLESGGEVHHVDTLEGHSGAINCIATLAESNLVVSSASDGLLKVWLLSNAKENARGSLVQTIELQPKCFALSLALCQFGEDNTTMLAAGGTRSNIQVFISTHDDTAAHFSHQITLSGHEGWIRTLDFIPESESAGSDILLASGSQDKYVRIWRLKRDSGSTPNIHQDRDSELTLGENTLSNKAHRLHVGQGVYSFSFEALLLGHEDWVYTSRWHRHRHGLRLLSSSADNSLAIWEPEVSSGVWVCSSRLGEISAQKGSTTATGSAGGFWAGLWAPDGSAVASLGRSGTWRLWKYDDETDIWEQDLGTTGHTRAARDISWSTAGTYLLSTSTDQTTRLHGTWRRDDTHSWHELSRAQIHGYDINCVVSINETQFVSGAEEKLLRVFDEPKPIAELVGTLNSAGFKNSERLPEAANIPVLGLSNKAVDAEQFEDSHGIEDADPFNLAPHSRLRNDFPPVEDVLSRHTLWPECEKLYGHGFEISAIACSHDGRLIATACKASSIDHAVIRLYGTHDWREIKPSLKSHSLTVTQLQFSRDDHYLLSVGRDRQWCVYSRDSSDAFRYTLEHNDPKGHSRMILGCSWAPCKTGRIFATASRDKTIKVWSYSPDTQDCGTSMTCKSAVTDIDFHTGTYKDNYVLAAGLESGEIFVYLLGVANVEITATMQLDNRLSPALSITRVFWQPLVQQSLTEDLGTPTHSAGELDGTAILAISSEDCSIRIVSMSLAGDQQPRENVEYRS